jgi:hypothetical protein
LGGGEAESLAGGGDEGYTVFQAQIHGGGIINGGLSWYSAKGDNHEGSRRKPQGTISLLLARAGATQVLS